MQAAIDRFTVNDSEPTDRYARWAVAWARQLSGLMRSRVTDEELNDAP